MAFKTSKKSIAKKRIKNSPYVRKIRKKLGMPKTGGFYKTLSEDVYVPSIDDYQMFKKGGKVTKFKGHF